MQKVLPLAHLGVSRYIIFSFWFLAPPCLSFFVGLCINHTVEFISTMSKSSYAFIDNDTRVHTKFFNEGKTKLKGKVPTYRSRICCSVSAYPLCLLLMYFNTVCNTAFSPRHIIIANKVSRISDFLKCVYSTFFHHCVLTQVALKGNYIFLFQHNTIFLCSNMN